MDIYEFIYSIIIHASFMTFVYFIIFTCIIYVVYRYIIDYLFSKDNHINYEIFMNSFIQVISRDNYFMNYGYWIEPNQTLLKANTNLVDLIFEKADLAGKKDLAILDVGCGYGEQDFYWLTKLDSSNALTAIDISDSQIQIAKGKCKKMGLESRLFFKYGDALLINAIFAGKQFDTILSVESAFHYKDRPYFFKSVYNILKPNGTFVICDIVLNNDYTPGIFNSIFLKIFSDFLHFPKSNLIKSDEWEQSIKNSGLIITEIVDITDKTFNPYYNSCFHSFILSKCLPDFIALQLYNLFAYVQPFSYNIATCKKIIEV